MLESLLYALKTRRYGINFFYDCRDTTAKTACWRVLAKANLSQLSLQSLRDLRAGEKNGVELLTGSQIAAPCVKPRTSEPARCLNGIQDH